MDLLTCLLDFLKNMKHTRMMRMIQAEDEIDDYREALKQKTGKTLIKGKEWHLGAVDGSDSHRRRDASSVVRFTTF